MRPKQFCMCMKSLCCLSCVHVIVRSKCCCAIRVSRMVRCGCVLRMVQRSCVLDFATVGYPANRCVGYHVDLCSLVFLLLCLLFVVARPGLGFRSVKHISQAASVDRFVDPVVDPSLVVCLSCLWICPFLCLCLVEALEGQREVEALAVLWVIEVLAVLLVVDVLAGPQVVGALAVPLVVDWSLELLSRPRLGRPSGRHDPLAHGNTGSIPEPRICIARRSCSVNMVLMVLVTVAGLLELLVDCVGVCLSVCLSVRLSVCSSVCLFVRRHVCICVWSHQS